MTLDVNTLHFASAVGRCAYVVVFLVMALSQSQRAHLWQWMGSMGTSMVGSLIMMSVPPDELPPIPVAMLTYSLYSASIVLSWTGLRSFFHRRVNIGLAVAFVVVPGLLYPIILVGFSSRLAVAAVFSCCFVSAVLATYETVRPSAGIERLWSQYIESVTFGFYALVFLLTIGMLIGTDMPINSSESARASMILDQVTGVFVYLGYVAMTAERANRSLARLAQTDPLTGLYNRRGLQMVLRSRFPLAGKRRSCGILIVDIDHFKAINDRHGHEGGDLVLTAFAVRMKTALRAADIVVRWGGEEFLALLPGVTPRELATVAERLRASVAEQPFTLPTGPLAVTVSIGAATSGLGDADFEAVTQRADIALYDAKTGGRNRVSYDPAADSTRGAGTGGGDLLRADLCEV